MPGGLSTVKMAVVTVTTGATMGGATLGALDAAPSSSPAPALATSAPGLVTSAAILGSSNTPSGNGDPTLATPLTVNTPRPASIPSPANAILPMTTGMSSTDMKITEPAKTVITEPSKNGGGGGTGRRHGWGNRERKEQV